MAGRRAPEFAQRVAGDTGESEPLQALADALATFPADRILVVSHPESQTAYREENIAQAERHFSVPVTHTEVSR